MTTFNESSDPGQASDNSQGVSFGANGDANDNSATGGDEGTIDAKKVEALIKRVNDSQSFIDQLKTENKAKEQQLYDLQKALESKPDLDTIMEKLNQSNGQTTTDPVDVQEIIKQAAAAATQSLTAAEKAKQEDANFTSVAQTLADQFKGEDVDAKVRQLAAENEMTFDEAVSMARAKPKTLLKLFGVTGKQGGTSTAPIPGSVNTSAFTNAQAPAAPVYKNITEARTDRERIDITKARMAAKGLDMYGV